MAIPETGEAKRFRLILNSADRSRHRGHGAQTRVHRERLWDQVSESLDTASTLGALASLREASLYQIQTISRQAAKTLSLANPSLSAFRVFRVFRGKRSAIRAHPRNPWFPFSAVRLRRSRSMTSWSNCDFWVDWSRSLLPRNHESSAEAWAHLPRHSTLT
jgi:hypothetical protein